MILVKYITNKIKFYINTIIKFIREVFIITIKIPKLIEKEITKS